MEFWVTMFKSSSVLILILPAIQLCFGGTAPVSFSQVPDGLNNDNDDPNKLNPYNTAPKNAYPFIVYLGTFAPNSSTSYVYIDCTGTLIARDWVLTGAQCATRGSEVVVVGDINRLKEDGTEQRMKIEKFFVHEKNDEYDYDIALVKLVSKVNIRTEEAGLVSLLNKKGYFNKMMSNRKRCRVAGWGLSFTPSGPTFPSRVLHGDVRFADKAEAEQRGYSIPESAFGSEFKYENPDCPIGSVCYGDTGAPVICKKGGAWIQTGIVSYFFSPDSCQSGIKAVTNVYQFYDWIQTTMKQAEG